HHLQAGLRSLARRPQEARPRPPRPRNARRARGRRRGHPAPWVEGDQEDGVIYDVIIAGAGPVGLFLASELRLAKLSVLVLEQMADPRSPLKRLPFGMRGLWGPSVEAFYRRGLLEQIAAEPRPDEGAPGQPRPGAMAAGPARRGPAGHFAGIQFDYA